MKSIAAIATILVGIAVVGLLLIRSESDEETAPKRLVVFCAAGLKLPVTEIAEVYRKRYGVDVSLQFGGTGTLVTQVSVAKQGDLFIAADAQAIDIVGEQELIEEVIPLAVQAPVLCVKRGNPKNIQSFADLFRDDVRVGVGNPEAASIGKITRKAFGDRWEAFQDQVTVMKPTVTEIAMDVTVGSIDVAVVWNSTVPQFKGLETIRVPEFDRLEEEVSVAVLAASEQPTAALKFARFLTARDEGSKILINQGFEAIPGDIWEERPQLLLYSGGVNRPAIESLLEEFSQREGAELTTVFNGCGVLCASMQAMQQQQEASLPDAYYACDLCFVPPVAEHFPEAILLTQTEIGIVVPHGNPRNIRTLADLAQPGLRVGLCNARQSTLGYMTAGMLRSSGLEESVRKNTLVEVPTADFLINQMRASSLDAAIVYRVNAKLQEKHLTFVPIDHAGAQAVQPFSIRADSPRRRIAERLLAFLRANRQSFEQTGFTWKGESALIRSDEIEIPLWLRPTASASSSEAQEPTAKP